MYVKIKKYPQYPDIKYLQIVESYRDNGKVRNRTLFNFGRLDDEKNVEKINNLLQMLLPHATKVKQIKRDKDIVPLQAKSYGPVIVFQKLWQKLELGKILKASFDDVNTLFDLERAVFNLVVNRLSDACSKRQMYNFEDNFYGLSKFDLHEYYRAMDYLIDHKDVIEKKVFSKMQSLSKASRSMVFFDTTSIVFYGEDKNENSELLKNGFSKKRRSDLKQIVVGVLMSEDGIPLGHETFAGNKNDVVCFEEVINKCVDKYDLKRIILVGDRGMISHKNIAHLENLGLEYVLGYRMRTISKSDREDVFKKVDLKKLKNTKLQYKEVEYRKKRLIFCYNKERAELDRHKREQILKSIKDRIKSKRIESIVSNKDYKKFLTIKGEAPELCKKKIAKDELFDGVFVLTSNAVLSAPQVVEAYKGLWQIEQGFRQLKSELKLEPLYHFTTKRIRAHVFICFLALIMRRELESRMKKLDKNLSYMNCLKDLKALSVVEMKVDKEEMHVLTKIKTGASKIFKALKMRAPKKVLFRSNPEMQYVVPV